MVCKSSGRGPQRKGPTSTLTRSSLLSHLASQQENQAEQSYSSQLQQRHTNHIHYHGVLASGAPLNRQRIKLPQPLLLAGLHAGPQVLPNPPALIHGFHPEPLIRHKGLTL